MLGVGAKIRWLVDQDLPQLLEEEPDAVPLTKAGRDVLTEALKEDRWVVTRNRFLLDSRTIPFGCPPIVIIDGGPCTQEALRRNLLHFEFCVSRDTAQEPVGGQRFLVEMDRVIYRLRPEGGLEELETWKTPSVRAVLSVGASV